MIVAPFDLLQLPKIAVGPNCSVPVFTGENDLYVGVSSSAVNKLSFRPPQVISAHAVAPGTVITAVTASESNFVVYGTVHRGKNFLNVLNPESATNEGTRPSASTEVPEEIGAIYLSRDLSRIAVVSKASSLVSVYLADGLTRVSSQDTNEPGELIYSSALTLDGSNAASFIVVSRTQRALQLRSVALDSRDVHFLAAVNIEGRQSAREAVAESYFSHANDLLYQTVGSTVYIYRVPDATLITMFELDGSEDTTGIVALPNNNAAIARGNRIDLIDCTFQSHISSLELGGNGRISMLAYFASASAIVAKQGHEKIVGLSVTPTQGTLLESVGRGSARKLSSFALAEIFEGFGTPSDEWKQTAESQLQRANDEVRAVLADLRASIAEKDGASFAQVVSYLKDPKLVWTEWHSSGQATAPQQQDLVYEDTDRNADRGLIRSVCEMAFVPRYKPFLPIGVAVYLLTHPLFPSGEPPFENLLPSLEKSDAILYRQALVSLTGITAKELVLGLVSHDNDTFLDAATRLQEDYGPQQILQGIRDAFGSLRSISSLSILIERLSRHPETIGLMGPFVDSMGLLAWDTDHIDSLQRKLSDQIQTVETCIEADAAITELFNAIGLDASESAIPSSAAELRNTRNQLYPASGDNEEHMVPKYSIETLAL